MEISERVLTHKGEKHKLAHSIKENPFTQWNTYDQNTHLLSIFKDGERMSKAVFFILKDKKIKDHSICIIDLVSTSDKAQRKGYASLLMKELLKECKKRKVKMVFSHPADEMSLGLHQKNDFREMNDADKKEAKDAFIDAEIDPSSRGGEHLLHDMIDFHWHNMPTMVMNLSE